MNELVEKLHYAINHISFQPHDQNAVLAMSKAILAIEAADRMASALGSLHQEAFINMRGGHGAVLDAAAEAFNAYQLATIGTATQKKD